MRVAAAAIKKNMLLDGDDHLAPFAERVGDRAGVDDGNPDPPPRAILDAEVERAAGAMDRAGDDRARHLIFFFSSRRRHTMSLRDWSSDVCSSDLPSGCS